MGLEDLLEGAKQLPKMIKNINKLLRIEITKIIQRIGKCCHLIKSGVALTAASGGVSEWPMEHAWKACKRENVSWVRISPPPNFFSEKIGGEQANSLACVWESSWDRCFACKTGRDRRPGRQSLSSPWGDLTIYSLFALFSATAEVTGNAIKPCKTDERKEHSCSGCIRPSKNVSNKIILEQSPQACI